MNITVAFVRENKPDPVSEIIMLRDSVNYSHVLMIFSGRVPKFLLKHVLKVMPDYKDGMEVIFHAVGEGIGFADPKVFFKTHTISSQFIIPLTTSNDALYGYIRGSLGKKYAYDQIAGMAVGLEADNGDTRLVCSEIIGLIISEFAGKIMKGDQDMWRPIHCFQALAI